MVASGTFQTPRRARLRRRAGPRDPPGPLGRYRNPAQLLDGPVLVVGASHSGADIAFEVARTHIRLSCPERTAGRFRSATTAEPPTSSSAILVFAARHVLTVRTPLGRKMRHEVRTHGGPLIRVKRADLAAAGVERVHERTVGVQDGKPVLEDGRVLDVANVVWCTGFDKDPGGSGSR